MTRYRCPICGKSQRDEPWATLAGKAPGPNMLAIGHSRHALTGLDAIWRSAMPDDQGWPRCIVCLRIRRGFHGFATGEECIYCGGSGEVEPVQSERFVDPSRRIPEMLAEMQRRLPAYTWTVGDNDALCGSGLVWVEPHDYFGNVSWTSRAHLSVPESDRGRLHDAVREAAVAVRNRMKRAAQKLTEGA